MMIVNRPEAPAWLRENYKEWGKEYEVKKQNNPKYLFNWKSHKGQKVNQRLLPLLQKMTNNHCSYCDGYPMKSMVPATIDHFRPKNEYPLLVYCWHNLFLCCHNCQERIGKFDKRLLKPDRPDYAFDFYFIFNYRTGELEPNPARRKADKKRAKITIKYFKLNEKERPQTRLRVFRNRPENVPISEYPYRFMFLQKTRII